MLRECKGHPMDPTIIDRVPTITEDYPSHSSITPYRQRSSDEINKNAGLPRSISAHRAQIPLYPGISGPRSDQSTRDIREGKPCRYPNEASTNEYYIGMEEEMDEWSCNGLTLRRLGA